MYLLCVPILIVCILFAIIRLLQHLNKPIHSHIPTIFAFSLLALLIAFLLRGSMLQFLGSLIVTELFLLPLFLICGFAWLWNLVRRRPTGPWVKEGLLFGLACLATIGLSLGLGRGLAAIDEHDAKSYVKKVIPLLEAAKKKTGLYPTDLNAIPNLPSLPRYLRSPHAYTSDGKTFRFEYWDPRGMMDGYYFSSEERQWRYFD